MEEAQGIDLTARQRYWLEHIQACEASGKTTAEYAAAHGLSVEAMYAGKRVLMRKGVLPGAGCGRFQRVQISAVQAANTWRIHLPNGAAVSFSGEVDTGVLARILATVVRLP